MENVIAEIQVSYSTNSRIRQQITTSYSAYEVFQNSWYSGRMELQEEFKVLLLNRANQVLGIYNLSKGGVSSTIVDLKLLFGAVLKANASNIVICHNHPSGKLAPSDADIEITNKIKEACKLLDVHFFDHIIISHLGYYSFAENKVC
ncbi:putative DNA repair protein [Flavobacterium psychrophilum]|uniref:JAB domain-containing protein n=1 Tax=Flavobacterium psychrophilum TaxID=96345 RepID=UPI000B7C3F1F|nr:JAB domain-containing protein [Flavobacterium psychrophilum]MCB6062368.1 JAB domain-containing protein [Flavobacterium psychrophilum]SNB42324.1 putative DNA repair protein [Flavobacterium psychrophilum]